MRREITFVHFRARRPSRIQRETINEYPPTNCPSGSFVSAGYNLTSDRTGRACKFTATDRVNKSARLGSLARNGGPTRTLLPAAGAPADDAIRRPPPCAESRSASASINAARPALPRAIAAAPSEWSKSDCSVGVRMEARALRRLGGGPPGDSSSSWKSKFWMLEPHPPKQRSDRLELLAVMLAAAQAHATSVSRFDTHTIGQPAAT